MIDCLNLSFDMILFSSSDAFAITIETRGNTGGPNLEELQSMGKARLQ